MPGRGGWGRRAALAGSVALLSAVLIGVPTYESSVRSAALAIQIDAGCLTDMGVRTLVDRDDQLDDAVGELGDVGPPVVTRWADLVYRPPGQPDAALRPFVMLARPGQLDEVDTDAVPEVGEVLIPEWMTGTGGIGAGDTIGVEADPRFGGGTDAEPVELRVAGVYGTIPTRPEPDFWCSERDQLRFSAFGDPPPPVMLVDPDTFDLFAASSWERIWVIAPDPDGLRMDEAEHTLSRLDGLQRAEYERLGGGEPPAVGLVDPVRRARQVGDFVSLTIAPLRWAGAAVSLVLAVGAAVMVARAERRELRLRALRGVGPVGLAGGELRWLAPTTLVGALVGVGLGWAAVLVLGPDANIEPSAIRLGLVSVAIGWLVATLLASGVIGLVGSADVDPRRRRRRLDARIGLELAVVALAIWSFVRLDTHGGVRQIGVEVRGGDLLAQAFPLLGALAVVVVLARPTAFVLRRLRRTGRNLPLPALLGLRRIAVDPASTVAVMLATALATAVAFQASALTASVDRLLDDKAGIFVGADLAIVVLGSPPSTDGLGAAATEVVRTQSDDRSIRFLGVDPSTFAEAVRWRDDASSRSLDELMAELAADPRAAIAVDPDGTIEEGSLTTTVDRVDLTVDVVATVSFFPRYSAGVPMLVVDRQVIDDRGDRAILVSEPIPDAAGALRDQGGRVTHSTSVDEIFDGTNFLSARWSYDTLTAFAVMLAIVTLVGQVLVLEARLRARRVANVLTRPMGMTTRREFGASLIEIGAPLLAGVVAGGLIGWGVASLAIGRLDALRLRQPPAVLVVDMTTLLLASALVLVVALVVASIATARTVRRDAAEVMRVAES
jgi:hypothetical protein